MVLDAKAMTWAAQNGIDTAKLKAAKAPIYGKWYFPELPRGVSLVNLETGDVDLFRVSMVAGEVLWVRTADLRRLGLGGDLPELHDDWVPLPASHETGKAVEVTAVEPMITMARLPSALPHEEKVVLAPAIARQLEVAPVMPDLAQAAHIHLPSPSIAPFVLGIGGCLILTGIISSWIFALIGVIWVVAGAVAWIRIGQIESASNAPDAVDRSIYEAS